MITAASLNDHPAIIVLWELSVRATHQFIPEEYIQEIKSLLPGILPQVQLYIYREDDKAIKGFTGVAEQKIEMLFIHPNAIGQGIGRQLTEFCIHTLNADKVDVNEQNEKAVGFYKRLGFVLTGRHETDSLGRPFPILEMRYAG